MTILSLWAIMTGMTTRRRCLFLGEPNSLTYARGRGDLVSMDQNIGRSVKRRPKTSEITYLSKEDVQTKPDGVALELRGF